MDVQRTGGQGNGRSSSNLRLRSVSTKYGVTLDLKNRNEGEKNDFFEYGPQSQLHSIRVHPEQKPGSQLLLAWHLTTFRVHFWLVPWFCYPIRQV